MRLNSTLGDARQVMLMFHWVQCAPADVVEATAPRFDPFVACPVTWPSLKVPVPKVAYRVGHGLRPINGNHGVDTFPYELGQITAMGGAGWFIHHFATRSVDQLRRKVGKVERALRPLAQDGTADHWRAMLAEYERLGDAALRRAVSWHIADCTDAPMERGAVPA